MDTVDYEANQNAGQEPKDEVGEAVVFAAGAFVEVATQGAKVVASGAKQVHQMFGGEHGGVAGNLRDEGGSYVIPEPLVDNRELKEIDALTERYERLVSPGKLQTAGKAIVEATPQPVKDAVGKVCGVVEETFNGLTKQELIAGALQKAAEGFGELEKQAARASVSSDYVIQRVNDGKQDEKVSELGEICLLRSYDVARVANDERLQHLGIAFAEGGATGAVGFWGLPANFALSMLVYFRAVQSVAMFYGYDVKGDSAELVIASEVFSKAMSPNGVGNVTEDYVGKILVYAESATVKQAAKKGWQVMAETGGAALLVTQMRSMANEAAKKALEKGGGKALEAGVFTNVLKQVGGKLTLEGVSKAVPIIGAGFGALFDTAQMDRVLDFADIFYHKRFILDKPERVGELAGIACLALGN